jgi:hypothetical protein
MMKKLVKIVLSGALVAGLVLVASSKAEATLQVLLQEDNGAWTAASGSPFADFSNNTFQSATFGDFTLSSAAVKSDNGNLGGTLSDLLGSAVSVQNNSTVGSHTLRILITQTGYTLPPGSTLNAEAGLGGSVTAGTVGLTGIFQAWVDPNNGLPALPTPLPIAGFTTGPQTASQNGSTLDTGSATGSVARVGPYSITSLTTLVLAGNSLMNFSNHVNVTATAVPEPISLSLLGTGLFAAASRRLWKRKQA